MIAVSGVGALEGALTLRALIGARPRITMITPDADFTSGATAAGEAPAGTARHAITRIAADLALELRDDRVVSVQPSAHTLQTADGATVAYDRLLLALGTRRTAVFKDALTVDDDPLGSHLAGLRAEIKRREVESIAFIAPRGTIWALALYELALQTAAHAADLSLGLSISVATPEPAPLAAFGPEASAVVRRMLNRAGISLATGARCQLHKPGKLVMEPGGAPLSVDRIVALPLLRGPSISGISSGPEGFVSVDSQSRVRGLGGIFAAGDMTHLPLKHGGLAAQQADLAAETIVAERAGLPAPRPRTLIAEAILVGTDRSVRLRAELGDRGIATRCVVFEEPPGMPLDRLITRRLTAYLHKLDRAATPRPGREVATAR